MKTETSSSLEWSKSEMEVAEIILDFHCHVGLLSSIPFSWGCKRKRTASPSPATQNYRAVNAGSDTVVKVEACSSATESDAKLKRSSNKKPSLKKKKETPLTSQTSPKKRPCRNVNGTAEKPPPKKHSLRVVYASTAALSVSSTPALGKGCGGRAVKGAAAVKVEAPETPPLSPAAVKSSKGKYAPKSHDINAVAVKAEISNFETPKLSKRKPSVKLQGESTLNTIHELTNNKNAIIQDIGKVKQDFERMQYDNLWLNAKKQELRQSKAENAMNKKQQQKFQSHHQNRNYGSSQMHKGKGVVHQTTSFYVGFSSTAWGQNINNNGPIALPDLNLPVEESINVASFQWLARSAQHIRRCDVNSTRKLI
ncbi:hypothetical protein MTR_3g115630 [Medicago truncatula]|uniref:Uncharacterized protein n=2 Tax=Medicago truncatula TaxID=3880 RepID=A0A072V2U7_MEDTR|nr:hypothetical protein MTR_3g115630 [Medicago truncatula]